MGLGVSGLCTEKISALSLKVYGNSVLWQWLIAAAVITTIQNTTATKCIAVTVKSTHSTDKHVIPQDNHLFWNIRKVMTAANGGNLDEIKNWHFSSDMGQAVTWRWDQ